MDVWIARCSRRTKCRYCPEPITNGEFMVVCSMFKKRGGDGEQQRHYTYKFYYHTDCWLAYGKQCVEKKELQKVETRGRPALALSADDKRARRLLILRRNRIVQLLREEISKDEPNYSRIERLGGQLENIAADIEPLGGVPKSWR